MIVIEITLQWEEKYEVFIAMGNFAGLKGKKGGSRREKDSFICITPNFKNRAAALCDFLGNKGNHNIRAEYVYIFSEQKERSCWYGPKASPPSQGNTATQVTVTETDNQANNILQYL